MTNSHLSTNARPPARGARIGLEALFAGGSGVSAGHEPASVLAGLDFQTELPAALAQYWRNLKSLP